MISEEIHRKIVLVGFMGTGKSTVAAKVADRLGWKCTDSDSEVVAEEGCTIAKLFETRGEEYFRDAETRVLTRLLQSGEPLVIATGGGAVLREVNRRFMLERSYVAALQASEAVIVERVRYDKGRPLLADDPAGKVRELMLKRQGAYDFAPLQVMTDSLTPDEAAEAVAEGYRLASRLYRA
ncbi:shikimate kinase [Paenibacillus pasadenensis]|uniref:shikimate kinase n=1 Tax=Paenibacillus pasadenensis TaxID=217090 RepID=UPI00203E6354|nr:shikimate kinase [Paenibacillus pasadenensis]MCM3746199.1 shikimate kinase [Paenibacillus pasadenensis]